MTEARKLDSYDGAPIPELTSVPTGEQIEHEDPLAVMHALLGRVVELDYTKIVNGKPTSVEIPNAYVARSETRWPTGGIYRVEPLISLVTPEQA